MSWRGKFILQTSLFSLLALGSAYVYWRSRLEGQFQGEFIATLFLIFAAVLLSN